MPRGKKIYDKLKELGMCVDCGEDVAHGVTRCQSCRALLNDRRKGRYESLRAQGLCVVCKEWAGEKSRCEKHLDSAAEYSRSRR